MKVSGRLINMLQELHARTGNSRVFHYGSDDLGSFTRIFEKQRRKVSAKLQNPRLP